MVEIISVHIPKTAGTTFFDVLLQIYGFEQICRDYPPDQEYIPTNPLPEQIKVIHGHLLPIKYDGYFPEAKRITWLRHPIFRLISEYVFAKTVSDNINPVHTDIAKGRLSFLDFAELPEMQNFMSNQIRGLKLSDFYFVGLQEFFLEDLAELKMMLKWSKFKLKVENSNTSAKNQKFLQKLMANKPLINKLALLNNEDMELYQDALNLRALRRQESKLLQWTLADWERSQFCVCQVQKELQRCQAQLRWQQLGFRSSPLQLIRVQLKRVKSLLRKLRNIMANFISYLVKSSASK